MTSDNCQSFSARIPKDIHQKAKIKAFLHRTSLNAVIVQALEKYIAGDDTDPEFLIKIAKTLNTQTT